MKIITVAMDFSKSNFCYFNFHSNNTSVLHDKAFCYIYNINLGIFLQVPTKKHLLKLSNIRNYSISKSTFFQCILHLRFPFWYKSKTTFWGDNGTIYQIREERRAVIYSFMQVYFRKIMWRWATNYTCTSFPVVHACLLIN